MNRRNFFTSLLKAAAGATVAYSFPSIIVPKNVEAAIVVPEVLAPEFGVLTYSKLKAAYDALKNGMGCEPDVMVVNKSIYNFIQERVIPPHMRFSYSGVGDDVAPPNMKFHGTIVEPSDFLEEGVVAGSYGAIAVREGVFLRDLPLKVRWDDK